MISDKYGRKPAILIGTLGAAIGMLVLGMATTYTQAIMGRVIAGFLSGNLGCVKAYLTEITDDTNRGDGFSYMSVAWNIGCMIAPLIGGILCKPAEKYPAIFSSTGLFGHYPYLLPCLICVGFNLISVAMISVYMKEPRFNKDTSLSKDIEMTKKPSRSAYSKLNKDDADETDDNDDNDDNDIEPKKKGAIGSPIYTILTDDDDDDDATIDKGITNPMLAGSIHSIHRHHDYDTPDATTEDDSEVEDHDRTPPNASALSDYMEQCKSNIKEMLSRSNDESISSIENEDINGSVLEDSTMNDTLVESVSIEVTETEEIIDNNDDEKICDSFLCCNLKYWCNITEETVIFQRNVLLVTSNYGLIAMAYIILEETIPLFLKLSRDQGGLEFDSFSIGLLLSITAIFLLFFTSCFLPNIASKSKLWMFRIGIYGGAPLTVAWPLVAFTYAHYIQHLLPVKVAHLILWVLLLVVCILKSVFACLSFTGIMIMINNSVYNEHLGSVNGFAQMLASLARCIGPAGGGIFWSLACRYHFIALNFLTVSVLLVLSLLTISFVPDSLDFARKKKVMSNSNS